MQELLKGQKEILEVIGTVSKKLDDYIARTDQRLDSIESELKRLAGKSVQIERCEKTVDQISAGIVQMQAKLDDLENRSRRNNLVVYGLRECTGETTESLRKTVLDDIFIAKMGVTLMSVQRIHRIGIKKRGKNRPVILRLYNFQEKADLYKKVTVSPQGRSNECDSKKLQCYTK